ncbi:hypothetical protein dsmv_2510 [Desulfococcus multivorans DSM 2059]|uniref:Uncharacterized protein n=1 Tax=Desulfococcus multivorans DSM 2059 TaxID=1121405 RepID=S7TRZ8_DESML|nr:hypothetical protein dsmv_2510 [Desulfococcus multivorans DSM 2059]
MTALLLDICAQRLSASEIGAELGAFALWLSKPVLNAFRHRRSVRSSERLRCGYQSPCSTPFGIGDRCGRRHPSRSVDHTSAQRLSASEIGAGEGCWAFGKEVQVLNAFRHRRSVRNLTALENIVQRPCSTPFGIGDRCGSGPVHIAGGLAVLNAFRHRRSVRTGSTRV